MTPAEAHKQPGFCAMVVIHPWKNMRGYCPCCRYGGPIPPDYRCPWCTTNRAQVDKP